MQFKVTLYAVHYAPLYGFTMVEHIHYSSKNNNASELSKTSPSESQCNKQTFCVT